MVTAEAFEASALLLRQPPLAYVLGRGHWLRFRSPVPWPPVGSSGPLPEALCPRHGGRPRPAGVLLPAWAPRGEAPWPLESLSAGLCGLCVGSCGSGQLSLRGPLSPTLHSCPQGCRAWRLSTCLGALWPGEGSGPHCVDQRPPGAGNPQGAPAVETAPGQAGPPALGWGLVLSGWDSVGRAGRGF